MTCAVAVMLWREFHWFLMLWLLLAILAVVGIPWLLWQSRKPQILEAQQGCLIIRGVPDRFFGEMRIPRTEQIELFLGHYTDNDGDREAVNTLSLLFGKGLRSRRVMLSQFSHVSEKKYQFRRIVQFLTDHGFQLKAEDGTK